MRLFWPLLLLLSGCTALRIDTRQDGAALLVGNAELGGRVASPYTMPRKESDPQNQGENYLALKF